MTLRVIVGSRCTLAAHHFASLAAQMDELTGLPLAFGKKTAPKKQQHEAKFDKTKRSGDDVDALAEPVSEPDAILRRGRGAD